MIIGPNPARGVIDADRIGRLLYRHLRTSAGDRAAEIRSAGGGRVRLPADLLAAAAADAPEELTADDALVVISISSTEADLLASSRDAASPPAAEAETVDPSDRSLFPNLSALHRFADDHGIDLTGVSKRDDVEAVIRRSLSRNTPTTPA